MGASGRIESDIRFVALESFVPLARNAPQDFTRNRKMPCDKLTVSIIARKGRSLKLELRDIGKEEGMGKISVAGYLKQREKLNPQVFLALARHHAANVYAEEEPQAFKGYLLLSIDGSTANLPTNEETLKRYGNTSWTGQEQAMCGLSCIFDSLNRQIINMTINRGGFNEREQVKIHLGSLHEVIGERPFVLIMDRGYPSFAFIADLTDAGIPYIIRCNSTFMTKEFDEALEAGGDICLSVELTSGRLQHQKRSDSEIYGNLKGHAPIPARCVLADIGGDAPERIVTNLPADEVSAADLKEMYHLRWGIETCFSALKDKLQMENFTGTKPILIEQDIFASAYVLNLAFDLANEAEGEIEGRQAGYRHTMTVNKSFAIGVVKDEILHMFLAPPKERREIMSSVVEEIKENLVPIRKDRAYSRTGLKCARSNRNSNTHKRVF